MFGQERIELKTPDQVRAMRRAGLVVADALAAVREQVRAARTQRRNGVKKFLNNLFGH